ncbi:MAG: S9 family peptidase [Candidatus Krumholzibacteria bacterium]|nr:S9 family peptidase [Candidatus Krumholzibacteria bacterium]MDH5269213.1 S9 family peptidase [Candidatus Krumholzibacteria bacterium]
MKNARAMGPVAILLIAALAAAPRSATAAKLTLEQVTGGHTLLAPLPTQIKWRGNGKGVSFIQTLPTGEDDTRQKALMVRDVPSGREHVLCIADTVGIPADLREGDDDRFSISSHEWNPAGDRVVFTFRGDLFLLDAGNGHIDRLTESEGDEQDAVFSPDGTMIAYARGNDLYAMDVDTRTEIRHTTTGCDTIYNGILNWVYMEELFTRGDVRAFWWSPDGSRLAFLEIRDGSPPVYPIVDQIPTQATYTLQHYPKPGDPNPVVRVGIVPARGGATTWADVDTGDDSYIARVYWVGDGSAVAIEKLNRAQDHLRLLFAEAGSGRTDVVLEESSSTWINVTYLKHYYEKKRQFLWGSEQDGHMHLYLHNVDGSLIRQVTSGDWEVASLVGVDEKKGRIWFTGNHGSVIENHLYRVNENGKDLKRVSTEAGTHRVTMAPDNRNYIDAYSSHERPTRYAVHNSDGKLLFVIGDQLTDALTAANIPPQQFLTIQHEGRTYHCAMRRPPQMEPGKRYPVIVFVYGGPGSQVVRDAWSRQDLWHAYMAENGYIVFSLDNRGSAGRGKAWEEPLLKQMGVVELEDQLAGVDYLKSLSFVDPERIGVWGWSYGGYMTLLSLFNAPDVFRAGVSVAPVTDWRLYDSIYTERYMKLPGDNAAGYDASAPLTHADKLEDPLLLMHGDADDNVHMQNSIVLLRALIDAGKEFEFMLYPQREHSIAGTADRLHLYRKMTLFFDRNLKGMAGESATQVP